MSTAKTLEQELESKFFRGPLHKAFQKLSDEGYAVANGPQVMRARRENPELRNEFTWLQPLAVYVVQGDEVLLYFSPHNPLFTDSHAASQLNREGNLVIPADGIEEIIRGIKPINVSNLDLKGDTDDVSGYIELDLKNIHLNKDQRNLVEQAYGTRESGAFKANTSKMLESGITLTRAYVLTSWYVKDQLKREKKGNAIARASRLGRFGGDSRFHAGGRYVDYPFGGLLGVRVKSAEGAAPQKGGQLRYTPQGITNYLRRNPITDENFAKVLLEHANSFYQKQKQ